MKTRKIMFLVIVCCALVLSGRIMAQETNVALTGTATQSTTGWNAPATRAIDGIMTLSLAEVQVFAVPGVMLQRGKINGDNQIDLADAIFPRVRVIRDRILFRTITQGGL